MKLQSQINMKNKIFFFKIVRVQFCFPLDSILQRFIIDSGAASGVFLELHDLIWPLYEYTIKLQNIQDVF